MAQKKCALCRRQIADTEEIQLLPGFLLPQKIRLLRYKIGSTPYAKRTFFVVIAASVLKDWTKHIEHRILRTITTRC